MILVPGNVGLAIGWGKRGSSTPRQTQPCSPSTNHRVNLASLHIQGTAELVPVQRIRMCSPRKLVVLNHIVHLS